MVTVTPIASLLGNKKDGVRSPPLLTEGQLEALEQLLAAHYVIQDLQDDLLVIVVRYLKHASRWFPDPQRPWHPETGYLD